MEEMRRMSCAEPEERNILSGQPSEIMKKPQFSSASLVFSSNILWPESERRWKVDPLFGSSAFSPVSSPRLADGTIYVGNADFGSPDSGRSL